MKKARVPIDFIDCENEKWLGVMKNLHSIERIDYL